MRARRAELSPQQVTAAGAAVSRRLESLDVISSARRVAAYRAVRGELCLDALFNSGLRVTFTLPRVRGLDLEFVECFDGQRFEPGSFSIPEPVDGNVVALADHDVVLMPLVAFDQRCRRLGQGGGFYDRALGNLGHSAGTDPTGRSRGRGGTQPPADRLPVTIGVAHAFQQVPQVPVESWDVALDMVVTDTAIFRAKSGDGPGLC